MGSGLRGNVELSVVLGDVDHCECCDACEMRTRRKTGIPSLICPVGRAPVSSTLYGPVLPVVAAGEEGGGR